MNGQDFKNVLTKKLLEITGRHLIAPLRLLILSLSYHKKL